MLLAIVVFLQVLCGVLANKAIFDEGRNSQICSGMYSKHDWGGKKTPHIAIKLLEVDGKKYVNTDTAVSQKTPHSISYVLFEYKDFQSIGYHMESGLTKYICDDIAINDMKICDEKQRGKFIINTNHTNATILTAQLTHLGQAQISYPINSTGFYCVATFLDDPTIKYKGVINFQNAFGELSASEIPKLPAYGILTLLYGISIALFGFQFYKRRKDNQILPLQRYLLAMLGLLTFDTLVVWSYYDLLNDTSNPSNAFAIFYMVFLSLLNAFKLTFSFFLLHLISLGYGVVVLKLDKKVMLKCKILAGINFVAALLYLIPSYYNASSLSAKSSSDLDSDPGAALLSVLPLIPITIPVTVYYFMILISIKKTTTNLNKQRQVIKLKLYDNLFKLIILSFLLTFGGVFFASFVMLTMSTTSIIEASWKGAFFAFDFAPSVIYFIIFMGIAWLWRPTETSYMLAVSQQLSTDESNPAQGGTEFELDDLSLVSHSDQEDDDESRRPDSFDLRPDFPPSRNPPPTYESVGSGGNHQLETTTSNTLFELGEESDGEDKKHTDDRLQSKD